MPANFTLLFGFRRRENENPKCPNAKHEKFENSNNHCHVFVLKDSFKGKNSANSWAKGSLLEH